MKNFKYQEKSGEDFTKDEVKLLEIAHNHAKDVTEHYVNKVMQKDIENIVKLDTQPLNYLVQFLMFFIILNIAPLYVIKDSRTPPVEELMEILSTAVMKNCHIIFDDMLEEMKKVMLKDLQY